MSFTLAPNVIQPSKPNTKSKTQTVPKLKINIGLKASLFFITFLTGIIVPTPSMAKHITPKNSGNLHIFAPWAMAAIPFSAKKLASKTIIEITENKITARAPVARYLKLLMLWMKIVGKHIIRPNKLSHSLALAKQKPNWHVENSTNWTAKITLATQIAKHISQLQMVVRVRWTLPSTNSTNCSREDP